MKKQEKIKKILESMGNLDGIDALRMLISITEERLKRSNIQTIDEEYEIWCKF